MVQYSTAHIVKPKSWEEFEQISRDAMGLRWNNPDLIMHGRPGQAQDGVDVYGQNHLGLVGIQCKNTLNGVSNKVITDEVEKAEGFSETLSQLYIATSAPRDKNTQQFVLKLTQERKKENKFGVQVLFWEDIIQELVSDVRVFFKHYPQYEGSYKKNKLEVDLTNEIYRQSCHLLDRARSIFPFYSKNLEPSELRRTVEGLHDEIGAFSSKVKSNELMFPNELVDMLFEFIESISGPVSAYHCFLTLYDDNELHRLVDVKEDSWNRISNASYAIHDRIRDLMKELLKTD
ncbi:hypothetical protein ACSTKZ_22640 [Vibrio parahaemolyticus]